MKAISKRTLPLERKLEDLRETSAALLSEIDRSIKRCDEALEGLRRETPQSMTNVSMLPLGASYLNSYR